jgi:hypothetical protein
MRGPNVVFPNGTNLDGIMIARQYKNWAAKSRQNIADSLHDSSVNCVALECVPCNEDEIGCFCSRYFDGVRRSLNARCAHTRAFNADVERLHSDLPVRGM